MPLSSFGSLDILPAPPASFDRLTEIWEAAARATHRFLSEADIAALRREVREIYLPGAAELYLARAGNGPPLGFLGLTPPEGAAPAKLEMLFIDPTIHGRGLGRAFVRFAAGRYLPLDLDVNEQNPGAAAFYRKCGFTLTGRSPLDGQGRPFPLLHMRLERST